MITVGVPRGGQIRVTMAAPVARVQSAALPQVVIKNGWLRMKKKAVGWWCRRRLPRMHKFPPRRARQWEGGEEEEEEEERSHPVLEMGRGKGKVCARFCY